MSLFDQCNTYRTLQKKVCKRNISLKKSHSDFSEWLVRPIKDLNPDSSGDLRINPDQDRDSNQLS